MEKLVAKETQEGVGCDNMTAILITLNTDVVEYY